MHTHTPKNVSLTTNGRNTNQKRESNTRTFFQQQTNSSERAHIVCVCVASSEGRGRGRGGEIVSLNILHNTVMSLSAQRARCCQKKKKRKQKRKRKNNKRHRSCRDWRGTSSFAQASHPNPQQISPKKGTQLSCFLSSHEPIPRVFSPVPFYDVCERQA